MSAGNQNKYGLDELEFIPGEIPFEKDAAWNKLQERMGEKKTKKNYWYLAAASIVIVLSAGIIFWKMEKGNDVVKNDFTTITNSARPANEKAISSNTYDKNSVSDNTNQKSAGSFNKNSFSKKTSLSKVKINKELSAEETQNSLSILQTDSTSLLAKTSIPDVINNIPVEAIQSQAAVQLQPARKKLKVLHHNQLQNTLPVTNPAYSAGSGNIQGITVFGKNKSADFIKIKITTPN